MGKRLSQKKIAEDLGVSQTLVSMVLNGRTEGIAKSSYEKIWEYALSQGYSPRGMKMEVDISSQMQMGLPTVGYILRAPLRLANKSNFYSHVHQGLHDYLTESGAKTVFLGSEDLLTDEDFAQFKKIRLSMRGLVIMGEINTELVRRLSDIFGHVVYIAARLPGVCHSITSNDVDATRKLVEHLSDLGHRSFAWIGGSPGTMRHKSRLESLEAALAQRNLPLLAKQLPAIGGADWKEGYECAEQLLANKKNKPATAWVCFNGLMARGTIAYLHKQGYEVGRDISVCAVDCTRVRDSEWPTLTASGAIPEEMGRLAGELIMAEKQPSFFQDIVVPASFFDGQSTGPAPVNTRKR
ncbi:LacI family DNA-binding transcriptional regulator [Ruficoccus amylovorans]|uniref:LacI family DNA-binding transcriptional regulator n=1 Tax=Ruficoccus amylovorans TaxID=1804625 RepID=A0A842HIM6_9BACT|nr:LacI family DNA-binding transcriptional regulator [Ruficoccus amylovorans]MBC2595061.1 LacI family DNA-binding transcriptional regulator [Ruficoccus amylovorans]